MSAVSVAGYVQSALGLPLGLDGAGSASAGETDHLKFVKIAIGTGGHGHTYPGATVPFGAVQLGPDTGASDWDHCSGYHYNDSSILEFSHTHLSGTGCIDMLDVLLMPTTDDFTFDPAAGRCERRRPRPRRTGADRSRLSSGHAQPKPKAHSGRQRRARIIRAAGKDHVVGLTHIAAIDSAS